MYVLRIEHATPNFEGWKRAFDADPADRKGAGVKRFTVLRQADEPNYASVDLEFETAAAAEALLARLRPIWARVQGSVILQPTARIFEIVEVTAL